MRAYHEHYSPQHPAILIVVFFSASVTFTRHKNLRMLEATAVDGKAFGVLPTLHLQTCLLTRMYEPLRQRLRYSRRDSPTYARPTQALEAWKVGTESKVWQRKHIEMLHMLFVAALYTSNLPCAPSQILEDPFSRLRRRRLSLVSPINVNDSSDDCISTHST